MTALLLVNIDASGDEGTMHEGFVDVAEAVPGVVVEPRYAGSDNFVGVPIAGYEAAKVVVSREVAKALEHVQIELATKGLALKLFDGYRPQRAVDHFVRWARDADDTKMKSRFYPNVPKDKLFELGYIAARSGHSRGGSIDVTLVRRTNDGAWQELDMGSPWDLFDSISHVGSNQISAAAAANRTLLAEVMRQFGFEPYSEEWWHFTLKPEPYPDTYFDFPIK